CPVIGFHGHDNLGMANANSVAALEAGAVLADGTLGGIGRGAGNAEIESLAGIFNLIGVEQYDYKELAKLSEFCRHSMSGPPADRNMEVLGGVIGLHSGYFPLVEDLCAEFTVDPAAVMETAADLAPRSPGRAELRTAAQQIAGSRD